MNRYAFMRCEEAELNVCKETAKDISKERFSSLRSSIPGLCEAVGLAMEIIWVKSSLI